MTIALILNLVLGTAVTVAMVGLLAWGIATQHRDSSGPGPRRGRGRGFARSGPRTRVAWVRGDVAAGAR